MAQLIELPTGDWVDPDAVTDIQRLGDDDDLGPRVAISSSHLYFLQFNDRDDAVAFAQDFGKAVNAARRERALNSAWIWKRWPP